MTKEEFISYVRGIIDSENLRIRRVIGQKELIGPLKLIKDALDKYELSVNQPFIPTPGFSINPEMVMYSEICSCNPKNGGSGICGCTIGGQMVPKPNTMGTYGHNWSTSTGVEL